MDAELFEAIAEMIDEYGAAREAKWMARRQAKAEARVKRQAARDAGLKLRHDAKLARIRAGLSIS
jgi:hypothetical protein